MHVNIYPYTFLTSSLVSSKLRAYQPPAELQSEEINKHGHILSAKQGGLAARAQSSLDSGQPIAVEPDEKRKLKAAAERVGERPSTPASPGPPGGVKNCTRKVNFMEADKGRVKYFFKKKH